jgi:EmrB/QacA subfamily drug resistance transporter
MTETDIEVEALTYGIDPHVYGRRWLILGVLCLSLVLVVAAVSSVNVAIPSIRQQLEPSDTQLLWIVDIYAVVFAGLLLPAGALGDRYGRRGALQIGLVIFGIASVLSSQAGSPTVLLAFRCLMGVGAALIMPSTLSLLTSVFPPHERPKAIAVWTGFAGAGGVIGTLLGGLVLTHFWWGSVFFVSVPIALIAVVMVTLVCPTSKESHEVPLDPPGALLSVVGFGSLLYGIIEGPEKGWFSAHSIVAFALCVVAFTTFIRWERRTAHPMLDVRFFSIPRFGAGALGVTFTFFAMFAMFFVLAQYLQSVRGYSPLKSGVCTLPFAITMIAISPRGAALAAKFDPRKVIVAGLAIMPIGLMLMSAVDAESPYLLVAVSLVVLAAGPALAIPSLSTGIVLSLPMDKAGVGSAVNDTTREVGGAVGIAVIGSILAAQYRDGIKPLLAQLPPEVAATARDGVGALGGLVQQAPNIPELAGQTDNLRQLLHVAQSSFVDGMQTGMRVSAAVVVIVMLIVWRWYPSGALRPVGMPNTHEPTPA